MWPRNMTQDEAERRRVEAVSTEVLDRTLQELGMGQNKDKAAHVPMFMGIGIFEA